MIQPQVDVFSASVQLVRARSGPTYKSHEFWSTQSAPVEAVLAVHAKGVGLSARLEGYGEKEQGTEESPRRRRSDSRRTASTIPRAPRAGVAAAGVYPISHG